MTNAAGLIACVPRFLPRDRWTEAAKNALAVNPDNGSPGMDPTDALDDERAALDVHRYWGQAGVRLTVGFIDTPDRELRARILSHMNAWSSRANVSFAEAQTDPQVRIARWSAKDSPGDQGYWSNIGTDIRLIGATRPTMNLEAFTMTTAEPEFRRVVRHEAGHTLGFPHEHMRKAIVERLDRDKVIAEFMRKLHWSRRQVIDQVLTPLEESSILGTPETDETSIMCYQIAGSLTLDGTPVSGGVDISESDYQFASLVYPKSGA